VRTGKFQGELTFIGKDGTSFPGEVSSVIFRDHDGRLKTSMIIRDMSEKKKREQDYQLLFREMLDGFAVHEIICDAQGNPVNYRFLTVNPAFERITGLKAEHIVGRTVLEVLPDTERYWIETYGRVALTGEPTLFENYSKVLDKYFVVTAFRSAPNQFACNFTDITERKRAEEALRESEKKFRTLTQNTPDIISRIDREGRHVFINKAIEKVTNLTVEDYLGKTNEELGMPTESLVLWNHQFRKAFETATLVNFEFDFPSPDGIRNFFSTVVPEFDEEGRVSTLLILARDITDRKESMLKLRKALETTVRAVAVTVETRDPYTAGHQRGVADLSRAIAMELKLTSDRIDGIQMAAIIHDLGKISVPAEILTKPNKLTEMEFELIKTHPQSGYDILKDIDFPWPIARMILEHHERMDGSGYPRNLRGDDILLESRILAVADVVESMASHRPYRPALGLNAALEEIEKNRGTIYDADAVDACLRLIREKRFQFRKT